MNYDIRSTCEFCLPTSGAMTAATESDLWNIKIFSMTHKVFDQPGVSKESVGVWAVTPEIVLLPAEVGANHHQSWLDNNDEYTTVTTDAFTYIQKNILQFITHEDEGEDNLHGHGALVRAGRGVAFCLAKGSVPSIENVR